MAILGKALYLAVVALSLCWSPGCAVGETRQPAALRQDLSISLHPSRNELTGSTTVTFDRAGSVSFSLSPSADIEAVTSAGQSLNHSFRKGVLTAELPAVSGAASPSVTVSYRASFRDAVAEHPTSSEDPTYGVSGAISERGTFLGAGAGWYPVPEIVPLKRSVRISAPAGTEAITSGRLVSRETAEGVSRSVWEEEHPVGELSLSAGPYRVAESQVGKVALYTYFYPENAALSSRYLEAAARYLSFYTDLFGAYPFEKFAVVENFFPTGYGLPSYTLLGSTVIRLPFIINTSFPHEIAHSWWGNAIEPDPREGNWSEGLVTYLADYLLKEKRSAAEAREYRLQILADYASLVRPEREFPLTRFSSRVDPASRAIGYGKAAMLFHMIREQIGDSAFFAGLRQVCQQHLYGSASWSDFIAAFSRSAGHDLAPFARQWLARAGGPALRLEGVSQQREKGEWVVSGTVVQTAPRYQLDVPLLVETGKGAVKKTVHLSDERAFFRFPVTASATRVLLDPEVDLFRILAPDEVPVTVNRLKGSRSVLAVVTKGCKADAETFSLLLESLDQRNAPVVTEEELDPAALKEHDLLFCGLPPQRFLPQLPHTITLSADSFTVESERYAAADGALFVVSAHPVSQGRVAGVFLPLSREAAVRSVPKITHYGKYGYLVFSGGENRTKGTVQPRGRSTVIDLADGPATGAAP